MCGVAGSVDLRRSTPADRLEATALAMAEALHHRGPDGVGCWVDEAVGVALGHKRLAIIDLSVEGHEPMLSADGRYVLCFNGEIYNHLSLRSRLVAAGSDFRGTCDAESLLEAIAAWGVRRAIELADGMFAFAVYDRRRRELILARDRLGEKPLYYGWLGGHLLFGSELKALRRHPAFRAEVDREAVTLFLRHGYVPSPRSMYQGIHKLPPATVLTVSVDDEGARPSPVPYWSLLDVARAGLDDPLDISAAEAVDALESLLLDTVSSRMLADVPLGAFLSGGVDSSTIVALMQAVSSRPVRTFTIGATGREFDETRHAASVARSLGTDHTEAYVTPSEAQAIIPTLPMLYDEPFADSSQIPTTLVSALARRQVKVALTGDGGDEIFGGYVRYQFGQSVRARLDRLPGSARRGLSTALRQLSPGSWDRLLHPLRGVLPTALRQTHPGDKLHKLAGVLEEDRPERMFQRLVSFWTSPGELVLGADEPATVISDASEWGAFDDFVDWMMYTDSVTYLPDDILVKVDRASMSRSLEVRVPYLAPRVVEFAWQLPRDFKIREGSGKWLLRQVLHRHVPPGLVERPKQGFGVPVGEWLRGPLRGWAEELLSERRLRDEGILDPAPIRAAWDQHLGRSNDRENQIWSVLMFQAWLEHVRSEGITAGRANSGAATRGRPGWVV